MAKLLERLSPELEELACDLVLESKTLDEIAKSVGLRTRQSLLRYIAKFPEFTLAFQQAQIAECISIEEEVKYVADKYDRDSARTKLEALCRILKWRDSRKYGDKTQIDMTVTVDIAGSLDRAERRVVELTATNVLQLNHKSNE